MTLRLYNTLTRQKEPFAPLHDKRVGVYVCGVTVWDSTHLGHGRAFTIFDCVVRYLRHIGYTVQYARNYTDVDDKIIHRAAQEQTDWKTIAETYIQEFASDMAALGNRTPDHEPRASDHIPEMIAVIEQLIARDMAYAVNGDVFYAVRKFQGYGKLSGKKLEELEVGARVEANDTKRDPLDFALWKAVKPGEPSWPSPWGDGRPGWHIECSAMSTKILGQPFDIHGGGRDLIFPHHENEIAQSEGASGKPFVGCWMHNGSLTIDSEKMSKSLGNYFQTSAALKKFDHEVLRYFLLSSHYRSPLDFTESGLQDAGKALDRIYETTARLGVPQHDGGIALPEHLAAHEEVILAKIAALPNIVMAALNDDLNTPKVFGAVFDTVRELNRYLDAEPLVTSACLIEVQQAWHRERQMIADILGVIGSDPSDYRARQELRTIRESGADRAKIQRLIEDRLAARKAKDFAKSDAIRDQLADMGVTIKDCPDGTTAWTIK